MVGRGASLDGCLFLGGTDGSNPILSSGESDGRTPPWPNLQSWLGRPRLREMRDIVGEGNPLVSVETAIAGSIPDNASPTERGDRVGCSFDPSKDMVERTLTNVPQHPGLGRARPQGSSGTLARPAPAH